MAGVANPDLASYYRSTADRRTGEVPNASWTNGCNDAGSNAPGIGVNTGDYSPKPSDWSEDVRNPADSAQIGQSGASATTLELVEGADRNNQPVFVQAAAQTAPGGTLITGVVNKTGKTVPAGAWAWGSKTVA